MSTIADEREYQASLSVYSHYGVRFDTDQLARLREWHEGVRVGGNHGGARAAGLSDTATARRARGKARLVAGRKVRV